MNEILEFVKEKQQVIEKELKLHHELQIEFCKKNAITDGIFTNINRRIDTLMAELNLCNTIIRFFGNGAK